MAKRLVVVVDMQKDFIDGVLGSAEAVKIVDNCVKRLEKAKADLNEGQIQKFIQLKEKFAEALKRK